MTSTAMLAPVARDEQLAGEILRHLDAQIDSARGLLAVVLEQGSAIRRRDVPSVVRQAGILRGEMSRRQLLEEDRGRLLERCGERIGVAPEIVTLEELRGLMSAAQGEQALARSAQLKGLLGELQREHSTNRAVMQVELGFLDHLMGLLALDGVSGYDTHGSSTAITKDRPHGGLHVLDLRA
jgi:hypothetical protein